MSSQISLTTTMMIIMVIMITMMITIMPIMNGAGLILPQELPTALSFPALRWFGPEQTL
jgi:hypothetical protein